MLISDTYAQTAAATDPFGDYMQLLPIALMFVVLYFLMIRPQMKRSKEHKALIEQLARGDEVVTGGGIAGRIIRVNESFIALEVADGVEIQVQKQAVTLVLPKGTLKGL